MTSDNSMYMPVAPAYGIGNDGMFGGQGAWWIIILLAVLGWGNGFGGFGGQNGGVGSEMQRGFDQSAVINGISGVQNAVTTGFGNVQTALCNGFAGVNSGIANGFAQAEISANARQMADMNQTFGLQSALQNCCCENRAATADLKYTVATEACADRNAISNGIRDVIENSNNNSRAIMDKLCALELDGVKNQLAAANRENLNLQNQLNMAAMRESQANQDARFQQGMVAEVDALYNRLKNCPVPSMPVYGQQPIFTCPGTQTCGCGAYAA